MSYPIHSVRNFLHNSSDKTFVGEASTTPAGPGVVLRDNRMAGPGMYLKNEKTGALVPFEKYDEKFDAEGELVVELFAPLASYVMVFPKLAGYTLLLFND